MGIYVKIDRATGSVLNRKDFDDIQRALNKPAVWIELVQNVRPAYDKNTQKVVPTVNQPDLSDLQVDVPPNTQRVQGYDVVALNAQELQARVDLNVSATNDQLFAGIELLYEWIANNPGVAPQRSSFPNGLWNKLNARRALKGQAPL